MNQRTTSRQQRRQQPRPSAATRATAEAEPLGPRLHAPHASHDTRDATTWKPTSLTALMLAPLRLFLGVTFLYAGIQKLTDPQFFAPNAPGYIGRQITAFAASSPLRAPLLGLALPHAVAFGSLVAWGELAIGLGTLLGLLLRPAAFFGALLSLIFYLSASWRVYPYFYGSDIVFLFAWLTLLLAGPVAGGWFSLDTRLIAWFSEHISPASAARFERWARIGLGVQPSATEPSVAHRQAQGHGGRGSRHGRYAVTTRKDFLQGALVGVAATLGAGLALTLFGKGGANTSQSSTPANPTATAGSGETATTTLTAGTSSGTPIATASQVPVNSSLAFTVPDNGDPGVLVHLSNGSFVAYDATCTHAGCPVQFDPSSKLLLCPCHGAAFDPAHGAEVIQGPAYTPLASVAIHVDQASGAITVSD